MLRGVAVVSPVRGVSAVWLPRRTITTRGQFNPIHDFAHALTPEQRARSEAEFETMITNPGPLRVSYSPDYLDWLYKAYQSKLRYVDARAKAQQLLQHTPAFFTTGSQRSTQGETEEYALLPGAPPPGKFLRPAHSWRRRAGAAARAAAQRVLDDTARQQGLLDLFERQPQFPAIHVDRATRFHLVELFQQFVLDRALEPREVWDRALLYRAILSERRAAYPASFRYIHDCVDQTVFAPTPVDGAAADARADRCPTERDYYYFLYLVRRYYVDNAIEAHVVLRCHREPNAAELLFSQPPPRDEAEVRRSMVDAAVGDGVFRPPTQYPDVECLWRCAENVPLLTVLVFAELNLVVSSNPFIKYPRARSFLTRPYAEDAAMDTARARGGSSPRRDAAVASLAQLITERRGHLLAPLPRPVAVAVEGRGQDLQRLQQRHHREDVVGFQALLRPTIEENGTLYHSYADYAYLNPHAVRAEERDRLSRCTMDALRRYDAAGEDLYRDGYEECELQQTRRPTELSNTVPTYIPTLPHFIARIGCDPHVAFLMHAAPDYALTPHADAAPSMRAELQRHIFQLGRALHQTALEYHKEFVRRVNRQKVNIAAALLDRFVSECWQRVLTSSGAVVGGEGEDEIGVMASRLGPYKAFETRVLDETGFPTDARIEDYRRWMAPPQRAAT